MHGLMPDLTHASRAARNRPAHLPSSMAPSHHVPRVVLNMHICTRAPTEHHICSYAPHLVLGAATTDETTGLVTSLCPPSRAVSGHELPARIRHGAAVPTTAPPRLPPDERRTSGPLSGGSPSPAPGKPRASPRQTSLASVSGVSPSGRRCVRGVRRPRGPQRARWAAARPRRAT
jgi:hypothetical protein